MARGRDGAMLLATLGHGALAYRGGRFEPHRARARCRARRSSSRWPSRRRRSGSEHATPASFACAGAASAVTRRPARPEGQLPAAAPDGEVWIGTDRGVVRWNGRRSRRRVPAALRTPALAMIARPRVEHLGRGRRGRPAAPGRPGRLGRSRADDAACRATRVGDLRGSRRQHVGRDRSRHRALARPVVHDVSRRRRACRRMAVGPDLRRRSTDGRGSRRSSGGLFWIQRRPVAAGQRGRPRRRRRLLDRRRRRRGVGRPAARRRDALRARRRRLVGRASTPSATGWRRTASTPSHRSRDGAVWAGTFSARRQPVVTGSAHDLRHANGLASNTVASMLEGARRHDVVRHARTA